MPHFLDLRDIDKNDLQAILTAAATLKKDRGTSTESALYGKALGMIFEKPSTRTRVSFEVAARELGGYAIVLKKEDMLLGHGETIGDTARVLSRYVHALTLRSFQHSTLVALADTAEVPVVNAMTNQLHPCQLMADLLTVKERWGDIQDIKIAWVGDGNNMANTWVTAAQMVGFQLVLACPERFPPNADILQQAVAEGARVSLSHDPLFAVKGAHVVATDIWDSVGDVDAGVLQQAFAGYQVNTALLAHAHKDAMILHCLPAHRGEEITDDVLDGPKSAVWDEAENRLHVQKAIIMWCMGAL
jgi:ornithine carbamoyltransferase